MALQDGFPSASGLADANDVRLALAGLMVRDSSGNPRTGIFFRNTTALVTSTATMNSSVAAFEAALSRSGQGVILLANNGATNVLHDTAPVANSRFDTIYMKQNDSVSPNADANSLPVFGILKGAPSVSPTLPTYATAEAALDAAPGIGAGAEPLTAVLIPSTATSMQSAGVVYTQLYQYTASTGGVVPFRTKTALDLWTTAQTGQRAEVLADSSLWRFDGAVWDAVELPAVIVTKGADQSISSGTVQWKATEVANASMFNGTTDSTKILIPKTGIYSIAMKLGQAGTMASLATVVSANLGIIGHGSTTGGPGAAANPSINTDVKLTAGDSLTVTVSAQSGSVTWLSSLFSRFSVRCVKAL